MFNLFKKKQKNIEVLSYNNQEDKKTDFIKTSTFISTTNAVKTSNEQAKSFFSKPFEYTGNRKLYDSCVAKKSVKQNSFSNKSVVKDPYTNNTLLLTKTEAKIKYGDDWQKHLAEGDHITPIEKIFNETKNNPWLTNDDIKDIANSKENLQTVSREFNNAKRSRTNEQFVTDDSYLEKTGVLISEQGKQKAIRASRKSKIAIDKKIKMKSMKNAIETGHNAGKYAATSTGVTSMTISGIMNTIAVIKGEKKATDALKDVVVDTGKATATGYVMGGGLTMLSQTLSNSSSMFQNLLLKYNVPENIITSIAITGNTLIKYINNEISTQECILELGEKGLSIATTGYSMSVGQALIPIPIVGAAVGALFGSILVNGYCRNLINDLKIKELEHQERQRIMQECKILVEQEKRQRAEFQEYMDNYFSEYKQCFEDAFSYIKEGFVTGDADSIIFGANKITNKLGGKVHYNSVEEFKNFLDSDLVDIL